MSSQVLQSNYSLRRDSAVYPRLRDKVAAFVLIFFISVSAAVFSDLVLGISVEVVSYAVVLLVLLLLVVSATVSRFFEWKRAVTRETARQGHQLMVLGFAYVEYAERLSQLEAERAFLARQSNSVLLHNLMNESRGLPPGSGKSRIIAREIEAAGSFEAVRRELYRGSRERGVT